VIYLDNNATTRPCDEAVEAARDMLVAHWHNPSSSHRLGQEARRRVELARRSVAALIGAKGREVVFTSGGTESVNLAVRGVLETAPKRTVVTTPIEHEAVRDLLSALARGVAGPIAVRELPVDRCGFVRPEDLDGAIDESTALVTIQWANNETGVVQPIGGLASVARSKGVPFHTDATQAVGKLGVDLGGAQSGVDLLTLSAHKFHGVKGAGALFVRENVRIRPVLHGTQELARRGGTEGTAAIAAMGAAADAARGWLADPSGRARVEALRDRLESALLDACEGAVPISPIENAKRLWNTTNIAFPGVRSELLVMSLSERGVCASAGSACASGATESSPVIEAMGPVGGDSAELAHSSVRFSLSRETTAGEVEEAIGVILKSVRSMSDAGGAN